MTKTIIVVLLFSLLGSSLGAQSYTLESIDQNKLRNQQLLGEYDSSVSFSVQTNSIVATSKPNWKKLDFKVLPFVLTQQFNSHHPFGWNDGAMIQAKGYQLLARPALHSKFGVFETQIAPELLFASNGNYPTNPQYGNPNNQSYSNVFLGQSFAKVNLGKISIGASSENLWWGPGINSSLLMSNNAPGFLHAFIRTNKPIKTPIGNIEFNLIGARLES
ncbi:MAG TPA: capsule assembly Wzi family protein, partial [Sediminibacterium sp.]|nr:capsule assembly Wzi family protein [Sediminibacterium sp.]